MRTPTRKLSLALAAIIAITLVTEVSAKPLKVYIMAGQSNMEGKARPSTLPAMAADPKSKALHDKIADANSDPRVFDDVYMVYFGGSDGKKGPYELSEQHGKLTVFGGSFGPELAFGAVMNEYFEEPILIIKIAWGGRNLLEEFRPPSAGPLEAEESKEEFDGGRNYRLMREHMQTVLADPGKYHPAYDKAAGYEIAGFVWFQGYNDLVGNYPRADPSKGGKSAKDYSEYSRLMACFIRDVRKEVKTPDMLFVIGVLGIGGETDGPFQIAQAAPADMPEFKGNVAAVLTGEYWDHRLGELDERGWKYKSRSARYDREGKYADLREKTAALQKELETIEGRSDEARQKRDEINGKIMDIVFTKEEQEFLQSGRSNAAYHYLGSAKIYSQIGEAFAEAMVEMEKAR